MNRIECERRRVMPPPNPILPSAWRRRTFAANAACDQSSKWTSTAPSPTSRRRTCMCIRCKLSSTVSGIGRSILATREAEAEAREDIDMNRSVQATPGRTSTASTAGWMEFKHTATSTVRSYERSLPAPVAVGNNRSRRFHSASRRQCQLRRMIAQLTHKLSRLTFSAFVYVGTRLDIEFC